MKKWTVFFVLCVGLTDAQYKNEVVRIVSTNLRDDEIIGLTKTYAEIMVRKMVKYKNNGAATEDTAARCFAIDLYQDITGNNANANPAFRHAIKHYIDENFPGNGFEP